jgi:DNA-binding NarL/FixJ family response regulator
LSNPGIARQLVLREYTVHRHLADILRKLDLSWRAAAAARGVRARLV